MTQSQPQITGTTHTLPFDKLSPRDFERLCLWLVEREGYERAEHLGAAGSEQGRDVIAWREGELWAFQCKRVQRFGPKDALAEAEKVLALPEDQRPVGLVFLVTCDVSANTRQQVREHCTGQMECDFWTGTELDEKVKQYSDIVKEFFQADEGSTTIKAEGHHIAQATEGSTAIVGDDNVVVGDEGIAQVVKAEGIVSNVTQIGKVVQNITQYIVSPPPPQIVYRDLRRFLNRNRWLLGIVIVLEIPLAALFLQYKDRFMLAWWAYLATAILLAVVAWSWANLFRLWFSKKALAWRFLAVAGILTIAWGSSLGLQIRAALFPRQFPPDRFGIAVATFGYGPDLRVTRLGRQISGLLYDQLNEAITTTPELSKVALTSIGVVHDAEQGLADGERVRAKLVIWGQILERDEGVVIHFQVLQTPGMTDNPSVPHVIPIARRPVQTSVAVETANSIQVTQIASERGLVATAFSLGLYYYFDPHYQHAAEQFRTALDHLSTRESADPTDLGLAYYYLGKSYQMLGKFEQSQEMLDLAAELNPDDPAAVLGQMYNYRVMGKDELEQDALNRAIALCNKLPSNYIPAIYDRAIAYEAKRDDQAALRDYRAIIRLDPNFYIAHLSAARALARLEDYQSALEMFQSAQDLAKDDPTKQVWLHLDMGRLYEQMGQTEKAVREYNQAIDLDPTLVMPSFHLASLYDELGETEAAWLNYIKLIEKTEAIGYNPHWAHELLAGFLYRIGNYEQAVNHYQEALRYPVFDASLLHTHLGQAYAATDEQAFPDKETHALAELETALQLDFIHLVDKRAIVE